MSTAARATVFAAALALLVVGTAGTAAAQAARTWVSGVGNDAGACSRTEPCRTFAGAISKTADGGEINALDPGGYGSLTITKSITIDGNGTMASLLSSGLNGVIVNAQDDDRVTLRNLSIQGTSDATSDGLNGIRFLKGKSLHVEDCVIQNFIEDGIEAIGAGDLHVSNTTIRNVTGSGIRMAPASGTPRLTVEDSRFIETAIGIYTVGPVVGVVDDSTVSKHTVGVAAEGAGELFLHDTTIVHGEVAVRAAGGAVVSTEGLTAVANLGTFLVETGGEIVPFTGALVTGNPPDGAAACDVDGASEAVACLDTAAPPPVCPEPVCPQPSCPAPSIEANLGDCKKCKQKGTTMVCKGCGIDIE